MASSFTSRKAQNNSKPSQQLHTGQRNKPRSKTLRVTVKGFKPQPNPYEKDGGPQSSGQQYGFKLLANAELLKALGYRIDAQNGKLVANDPGDVFLDQWMAVNPREQKLTGPIMKSIQETWDDSPHEFYRVNRGLVITADRVSYDNETGTAQIVLTDPKKHGIVDGAHTFRKVVEDLIPATYGPENAEAEDDDEVSDERESELLELETEKEELAVACDRYLSCEIWTGLTLPETAFLTQGRNTSRSVPPYAIMEMEGKFEILKVAINAHNPEYCDKWVAFKPNEHLEGVEGFKPVSVLEILQLMVAMDITNYDENNHPIKAYENRGRATLYSERLGEYTKMLPLIGDFLRLFDMLRQVVPGAYDATNSSPRRWSKVLVKKGQKVDNRLQEPLYYLDPSGDTKAVKSPNALFFPMFSAFRANLKEGNGQYQWFDGTSPTDWTEEEFQSACQRLAQKVAKAAKSKDTLHAVGRDHQVWATCYETLNTFLFENGRKKKS